MIKSVTYPRRPLFPSSPVPIFKYRQTYRLTNGRELKSTNRKGQRQIKMTGETERVARYYASTVFLMNAYIKRYRGTYKAHFTAVHSLEQLITFNTASLTLVIYCLIDEIDRHNRLLNVTTTGAQLWWYLGVLVTTTMTSISNLSW